MGGLCGRRQAHDQLLGRTLVPIALDVVPLQAKLLIGGPAPLKVYSGGRHSSDSDIGRLREYDHHAFGVRYLASAAKNARQFLASLILNWPGVDLQMTA